MLYNIIAKFEDMLLNIFIWNWMWIHLHY